MNSTRTLALVGAVLCVAVALPVVISSALQLPRVDVPERMRLTITGLTVVRPGLDRLENYGLTLDKGLIEAIAPAGSAESSDLEELSGTYALPGLVDMHTHHLPNIGRLAQLWDLLLVAHGVTTVRDVGVTSGPEAEPMALLSAQVMNGDVIGPRIYYCGPTLDGDPPSIAHFKVVRSEDEARQIVSDLADQGCSCVKTYNLLGSDLFRAVHDGAKKKGLGHVAHLPYGMDLLDVRDVDLQHYAGIGSSEPIARFADQWMGWPALGEEDLAEIVTTSREQGIAHTPTMVMWANMSTMFDPESRNLPQARLMPRFFREVLWTAEGGEPQFRALTADATETLTQSIPKMQQLTRMLYEGGVPIHIGTDPVMPYSVPGYAMHQEMRQFVEAGLPPETVWGIATREAGNWLGDERIGRLEVGAYADVLFFEEDPTRDLAHLDSLVGVIADGRYYSRQVLDQAITEQRDHFEGTLYDTISMTIANSYF